MDWKDEESFAASRTLFYKGLTFGISKRYISRKSKSKKPYNLSIYSDDNGVDIYSETMDSIEAAETEAERLINALDSDRLMVFSGGDEEGNINPSVVVLSGDGHIHITNTVDANPCMVGELVDYAAELAKRYRDA